MDVDAAVQARDHSIECPLLQAEAVQMIWRFIDLSQQRSLCILIKTILQINGAPNAMRRFATIARVSFWIQGEVNIFTAPFMIVQYTKIIALLVEIRPFFETLLRLCTDALVQIAQFVVVIVSATGRLCLF